jgi:hypothetical protein
MPKPERRFVLYALLLLCVAGCKDSNPGDPDLIATCYYFAWSDLPTRVSVGKHNKAKGTVEGARNIADACQTLKVYCSRGGLSCYVLGAADGAIHGVTFSLKSGEDVWCGNDLAGDCRTR